MLIPLWPYARWDGVYIAVLIAAAVQLVSPWNESAALYALGMSRASVTSKNGRPRKPMEDSRTGGKRRTQAEGFFLRTGSSPYVADPAAGRYGIGLQ